MKEIRRQIVELQPRARTVAVAIAGISVASFAMLMPITSQAQSLSVNDIQIAPADSITATRSYTDRVKGIVKGKTQTGFLANTKNDISNLPSLEIIKAVVDLPFVLALSPVDDFQNESLYFDFIDEKGKRIEVYDKDVELYILYVDKKGNHEEIERNLNGVRFTRPYILLDEEDFKDNDGKPLKEVTLLIKAEGYEPVKTKVKYPKRNTKKTIKLKSTKK